MAQVKDQTGEATIRSEDRKKSLGSLGLRCQYVVVKEMAEQEWDPFAKL